MTARRRTDGPVTIQSFLHGTLQHALDWPGTTVRLERDSVEDFVQRPVSGHVSLGELCHENSKLWPARLRELGCSRVDAAALRADVVRRQALVRSKGLSPLDVDPRTRKLLAHLSTLVAPELSYAVELRLVTDGVVAVWEPVESACHVVKILGDDDRARLATALALLPSPVAPAADRFHVFVVGSFARNELLYGHRGHRRTHLEAGQLVQALCEAAQAAGLQARTLYEFADREVDRVLEADGIEDATLAVVALAGR